MKKNMKKWYYSFSLLAIILVIVIYSKNLNAHRNQSYIDISTNVHQIADTSYKYIKDNVVILHDEQKEYAKEHYGNFNEGFSDEIPNSKLYNESISGEFIDSQKNKAIDSIIDNSYTYETNNLYNELSTNEISILQSQSNRRFDENNALVGKTETEIRNYFENNNFECSSKKPNTNAKNVITDPIQYLHNNVGKKTDKYTVTTKTVSGVSNTLGKNLTGGNNCTLTALYNIMIYYRIKGYKKIPKNSTLYTKIMTEAKKLGYTDKKGLSVTKNDNLVKNTWRNGFGYKSGTGSNNYLWTYSSFTKAIDKNRPCMFSLASGYYYNHTIVVYGYSTYKNTRTKKSYTFLLVYDGWDRQTRYLAMKNTGESYVGCMTSITPPK